MNEQCGDIHKKWLSYAKDHNFYKGKKIDADCNFLKDNNVFWDDVIIPSKIRQVIKNSVESMFKYKDILIKNQIAIKRGCIFEGNPGCVIKGTKIKIRMKNEEGKHLIVGSDISKQEK
jgi:hypothetical protein